MKKLCLILALIMALGVLVGCSSGPDKDGYYHAGATFEYDGFKVKVGKYEIVGDKVTVPIEITNKRTDSYGNTNFAAWRGGFNDEVNVGFLFDFVYYSESIPGGDTVTMVASMPYQGAGEYKIYCTKTGDVENYKDPNEKIIVFKVKGKKNSNSISDSVNESVPIENISDTWAEDFYNDVLTKLALSISNFKNVTDIESAQSIANSDGSLVGEDMIKFNSIISAANIAMPDNCIGSKEYWNYNNFYRYEDIDNVDLGVIQDMLNMGDVSRYSVAQVQSAFDSVYGEGFCDVKTQMNNRTNMLVSSDKKLFYIVSGGMGMWDTYSFLNLADVLYSENEAVLTLQIIGIYGEDDNEIVDLVSGQTLTTGNKADIYTSYLSNSEILKAVCEENNIDINSLKTAKLKLFCDSKGAHIAGWEGEAPTY